MSLTIDQIKQKIQDIKDRLSKYDFKLGEPVTNAIVEGWEIITADVEKIGYEAVKKQGEQSVSAISEQENVIKTKLDEYVTDVSIPNIVEQENKSKKVLSDWASDITTSTDGVVSVEREARISADTVLDNKIEKEITDRTNADNALGTRIDNIGDSLATVATTGSYNDLDDKPTIPTVPSNISSFTNDVPYATKEELDAKDSLPEQTGNANKFLKTDGDNAVWADVPTHNIGEMVWSALPQTDAGLHLLDGKLLASDGIYDGFVNYVGNLFEKASPVKKWLPKEQIVLPTFSSNTQNGITISDARGNTTKLQQIFNGTNQSNAIGLWSTYWINIEYSQNTLLSSYTIQADNTTNPEYPSAWVVNGSNDGNKWVEIDSRTGITFSLNETKTFTVNSTTPYKQYRIVFSAGVLASNSGEMKKISFDAYSTVQGYDSGLFFTEEQWQSCVTKYGSCGKFVYSDDGVRLPKVSDILQATTDVSMLGDLIEAGLPNITGRIGDSVVGSKENSGAFSQKTFAGTRSLVTSGESVMYSNIAFNASLSSSIYGKSNTVQPQSIKALLYICVSNTVKTDIQVNIDNVTTELNNKADLDLSNVNNNIRYVIDSYVNGYDWYRKWSDGWIEQGGLADGTGDSIVTFMLPMASANYNITLACATTTTDYDFYIWTSAKTTTGIKIYSPLSTGKFWSVRGMGA